MAIRLEDNAPVAESFPTEEPHMERRFGGVRRLYGEAALARFQAAHVCVIGIGGVGSWAAEALARNAIGHITLIDLKTLPNPTSTASCMRLTALSARPRSQQWPRIRH